MHKSALRLMKTIEIIISWCFLGPTHKAFPGILGRQEEYRWINNEQFKQFMDKS